MNKTYSITEVLQLFGKENLNQLINDQKQQFKARFKLEASNTLEVEIAFLDTYDTNAFYQEIKFNPAYQALYAVRYHNFKPNTLIVSGGTTLFDYFGSREPNLLTLSRDLKVQLKIEYIQPYTGVQFFGEVIYGELLSRHCIVEVSALIPELGLGCLHQIGSSIEEFDLLLTRFQILKPINITIT